uniref:ArfGAP with dual PH domains 1 n=1 Tax=Cyprinus carpio TaxID=7962 RepID=A0A8C2GRC3_CYPCA
MSFFPFRSKFILHLNMQVASCFLLSSSEPDWVSVTLGVFVCQGCSLIHRSIESLSQVKSVLQDTFEDKEIEFITSMGNEAAKAKYEQLAPPFYHRPSHTDCRILREQWIRAKYERQEFIHIEKQEPYSAGYREGFLWKRGRDNGQFLSRKFILSEREGALKYFNKHDVKPKAIMRIETLNATFQPAKIGNPCGLQITYLRDNSTRNIFVYHEDSKVSDLSILRDDTDLLTGRYPFLIPFLTSIHAGVVSFQHTEGFKKRWFTMDDRRLMYFKDPLVFIGSKENRYTVVAGLPPSIQGYHWKYGITIGTPDRKFLFACETEAEQKDWIAAFQRVVNRPMMPQEYAGIQTHRINTKNLIGID